MVPEALHNEETLKIGYLPGDGDRLVVSLSGVGRKRNRMPHFEFVKSASDGGKNHVMMVADRTRSWLNRDRLAETIVGKIEHLRAGGDIREVITLGNSMGGFMALVLPQLTRIDRAVAFSPQYSMHPAHVPEESRWQFWRDRIPGYVHETVGPLDHSPRNTYIFHGDSREEEVHWARFPRDGRRHHFIVRQMGHDLAREFRDRGILKRLVRNAIAGRPRRVRAILSQHYEISRPEELLKKAS